MAHISVGGRDVVAAGLVRVDADLTPVAGAWCRLRRRTTAHNPVGGRDVVAAELDGVAVVVLACRSPPWCWCLPGHPQASMSRMPLVALVVECALGLGGKSSTLNP